MPGDKPPAAAATQIWEPGTGQDPAKYLVNPGHWDDGSKSMTPGDLAHARPWIDSGHRIFVWPTPTEGFRRTSQTTLGIHKYIGDQYVDAQIIHRDDARIEMTGVFPGLSAQENMVDFQNTLNDDPPDAGMILFVPGVFEQLKYVIPESFEMSHDGDDQTHSIAYTVTFVMIGEGRKIPDPSGQAPVNPFPATSLDVIPPDPWQIRIGIMASSQPGAPTYDPGGSTGSSGSGGTGSAGTGGTGPPDPNDFMYGNTVPGYTVDQLWNAAKAGAPEGGTAEPAHIMKNGQLFNADGTPYSGSGTPYMSVKYIQSDGSNTVLVPLPPAGAADNQSSMLESSGDTSRVTTGLTTTVTTTHTKSTLMDIADDAYGDPWLWGIVYDQNEGFIDSFGVEKHEAASFQWPSGIHLAI